MALACNLTALQCLHFACCSITDAVLPLIAKLTSLWDLDLEGNDFELRDADLQFSTGLACLTELGLAKWRGHKSVLDQLKDQLPLCGVSRACKDHMILDMMLRTHNVRWAVVMTVT